MGWRTLNVNVSKPTLGLWSVGDPEEDGPNQIVHFDRSRTTGQHDLGESKSHVTSSTLWDGISTVQQS